MHLFRFCVQAISFSLTYHHGWGGIGTVHNLDFSECLAWKPNHLESVTGISAVTSSGFNIFTISGIALVQLSCCGFGDPQVHCKNLGFLCWYLSKTERQKLAIPYIKDFAGEDTGKRVRGKQLFDWTCAKGFPVLLQLIPAHQDSHYFIRCFLNLDALRGDVPGHLLLANLQHDCDWLTLALVWQCTVLVLWPAALAAECDHPHSPGSGARFPQCWQEHSAQNMGGHRLCSSGQCHLSSGQFGWLACEEVWHHLVVWTLPLVCSVGLLWPWWLVSSASASFVCCVCCQLFCHCSCVFWSFLEVPKTKRFWAAAAVHLLLLSNRPRAWGLWGLVELLDAPRCWEWFQHIP